MDKVRLEPLERAELNDLEALQGLPYEHMRRAIGELLGSPIMSEDTGAGGLLSAPTFNADTDTGTLTLGPFSFVEITRGPELSDDGRTATPEARLVRFLPSHTEHPNHPVDISAHLTAGDYELYARRLDIATDTATRRRWEPSLGAEVSYTPATRFRERVEFVVASEGERPADEPQATGARWVKVLRYSVSSSGSLSYGLNSALNVGVDDIANDTTEAQRINTDIFTGRPLASGAGSLTYGLFHHLAEIRAALYRVIDRGSLDSEPEPLGSSRWQNPRRSLRSLASELQTLASNTADSLASLTGQTAAIDTRTEALEQSYNVSLHMRLTYSTTTKRAYLHHALHSTQGAAPALFFDYTDSTTGINGGTLDDTGPIFNTFSEALELFRRPVLVFAPPPNGEQPPAVLNLQGYFLGYPGDALEAPNPPPRDTAAPNFKRLYTADPFEVQPNERLDNLARLTAYTWTEHGNSTPRSDIALALALEGLTPYINGDAYSLAFSLNLTLSNGVSFL